MQISCLDFIGAVPLGLRGLKILDWAMATLEVAEAGSSRYRGESYSMGHPSTIRESLSARVATNIGDCIK